MPKWLSQTYHLLDLEQGPKIRCPTRYFFLCEHLFSMRHIHGCESKCISSWECAFKSALSRSECCAQSLQLYLGVHLDLDQYLMHPQCFKLQRSNPSCSLKHPFGRMELGSNNMLAHASYIFSVSPTNPRIRI